MSALDEPIFNAADLVDVLPESRFEKFEQVLARLSDRLNPILVKEARQALRSKQFTTTFFLMLAAGWTWSILGLALLGPSAYYNAEGPRMFFVYYMILAAPLLIVIPYYAYTSLSAERQDRTYELVSITALSARHILAGKLCGSGLQMLVYLSALFPCLAFTYLLRGLDIFSVFLAVAYTCLLSIGLAMVGLLLAALAPSRQRQMAQGVLFAIALCYAFGLHVAMMSTFVGTQGALWETQEFWEVNGWLALLYVNSFALVFLGARSLLTSVCQNRSTALRVALVSAQLSFTGWATWAALKWDNGVLYGLVFVSTVGWYFAGALMVGESPVLSARVRRDLPQSGLARMFLTWFNPGPATGYAFAVTNLIAVAVMATFLANGEFYDLVLLTGATAHPSPRAASTEIFEASLAGVSYLAIYLGLGKLILGAVRRYDEIRLTVRVLVHVLLVLAGGGIPWIIQITYPPTRNAGYTLMQITNPVWTLWEYCTSAGLPPVTASVLLFVLPLTALVVWALNFPGLAAELRQVRVAVPTRVAEEDSELAAAKAPELARTSPWDE
ncbi:MAG TPA: hypothetical protein VFW87_18550 [Pirellulales bacterium]|nr:hypothetical protein [Pirellulales bacterium]